ncbi:MAG: hypothetical protein ABFS14_09945 [Gemmatimonadota bacterium]
MNSETGWPRSSVLLGESFGGALNDILWKGTRERLRENIADARKEFDELLKAAAIDGKLRETYQFLENRPKGVEDAARSAAEGVKELGKELTGVGFQGGGRPGDINVAPPVLPPGLGATDASQQGSISLRDLGFEIEIPELNVADLELDDFATELSRELKQAGFGIGQNFIRGIVEGGESLKDLLTGRCIALLDRSHLRTVHTEQR